MAWSSRDGSAEGGSVGVVVRVAMAVIWGDGCVWGCDCVKADVTIERGQNMAVASFGRLLEGKKLVSVQEQG